MKGDSYSYKNEYITVDIKSVDYTIETHEDEYVFPRIHVIGRTESGTRVHMKYDDQESYFYIPLQEYTSDLQQHDKVKRTQVGYESIYGENLVKVVTYIPPDVPKIRGNYTHYEGDVHFPLRFMIDNEVKGALEVPIEYLEEDIPEIDFNEVYNDKANYKSRISYIDIEVDDSEGFPDSEDAEKEIVCIAAYDNYLNKYFIWVYDEKHRMIGHEEAEVRYYEDEYSMLKAFTNFINDTRPDILTGWNFEDFDAKYIVNRLDNIDSDGDDGLEPDDLSPLNDTNISSGFVNVKGLQIFDMFIAYQNSKFTDLDSYKLEDVAQKEIGSGKIQDGRSIYEQWTEDLKSLIDYNVRDVELLDKLEETADIIKFYETVSNFVGANISSVVYSASAVDAYILREANGKYVLPSKSHSKGKKFEGAVVFDPSSGISDNVIVLDLKSLYPMSMKTVNASPETKIERKTTDGDYYVAPNGVKFSKEEKGMTVEMIDNLMEERSKFKNLRDQYNPDDKRYHVYDRQQNSTKVILNTIYGVIGSSGSRLGDKEMGAAVTATGRAVIKLTQKVAEDMGYEVIYGDTDSIMVELGSDVTKDEALELGWEIEEEINEAYDKFAKEELNADEHYFELEFEKLYKKFFQAGRKKRYAGHVVWKEGKDADKIDIVGFESQRSDYAEVPKSIQKNTFNKILRGTTFDELSEYISKEIEKIKNQEYGLDELGIPGSISKKFENYDSPTKYVVGSKFANKHFGEDIGVGDKPKGLYVKRVRPDEDGNKEFSKPNASNNKVSFACWMNPENVPDVIDFDWELYIEKQIKKPLSRVFDGTGWTWSELIDGTRQQSLTNMEVESESDEDPVELKMITDESEEEIDVDIDFEDVFSRFEQEEFDEDDEVEVSMQEFEEDQPSLDSYM